MTAGMKRMLSLIATAVIAVALPFGTASASAKSPLEGRWKNGKMEIVIAPCGAAMCGTVVKASPKQQAKAERGSGTDLIGARLINDIHKTGPSQYKARVYLADKNMHARGTIKMVSPNRLDVKGCVWGVICKGADWDRVR